MSARARNMIMGMERYGKKEIKSTASVNEMGIVCEGEGKGDDKQHFYLPVLYYLLGGCNRKYQKRPRGGGLGWILLFQVSFESTIVIINFQSVMTSFDWQNI